MPVLPPPLPPLASHCSLRQGRNIEFGMREDEHTRMCLTAMEEKEPSKGKYQKSVAGNVLKKQVYTF